MNYLVNLAFDGSYFQGTQIQKDYPTLQGLMEDLLSRLYDAPIKIACCSRLDAKVSALDYYFSYKGSDRFSPEKIKYYLTRSTDPSILIKAVSIVPEGFSAFHTPHFKEYIYGINNGLKNPLANRFLYPLNMEMDLTLLKKALQLFEGKHDFSSFSAYTDHRIKNQEFKSEIYQASFETQKDGKVIVIHISGKNFFKYEVRMIIGSCLKVACKRDTLERVKEKLDHPNVTAFKIKLPAYPLILFKTTYLKD